MTLAAVALRAVIKQGTIEIGLSRSGKELEVSGYARQKAGHWKMDAQRAEATVTFGPFLVRADYDAGLLIVDGEVVDTLPTDDGLPDSVGPGTELGYRAVLRSENA